MKTLKERAEVVMSYMEMCARFTGWYAKHSAFMENPADFDRAYAVRRAVTGSRNSVSENTSACRIYSYYQDTVNNNFTEECYVIGMETEYKKLQNLRLPRITQCEHDRAFAARLAEINKPAQVIDRLANVLRGRTWHRREQDRGGVHRAIYSAWAMAAPACAVQLMMEWPRASKEGHHKIAYTRDEKYGEADRQLVTTIPKYLTRHFPTLRSDTIRDIAALYVEAQIGIVRTIPEMLEIIEHGPSSCMSGEADNWSCLGGHHPYEVYDPQYGWHMAYVKEGDRYTGRVLLNDTTWVRTYRRADVTSIYSSSDDRLNAWLRENGYANAKDWEGFKLRYIRAGNNCGFVAPYLDGTSKDVDIHHDEYLRVVGSGEGEYNCNNTNGDADECARYRCDNCNDRMDEDDSYTVYRHCDLIVCRYCYESDFIEVIGRRGETYAIRDSDAIEVDGMWYDPEWLSDNNIVMLLDGEYCHQDDAVYVASDGEWYGDDDARICYTKAGVYELRDDCVELADGEWCLADDAWCCEHSGDWYENDVDSVTTKGGKRIHEDYADEYILEGADEAQQAVSLE